MFGAGSKPWRTEEVAWLSTNLSSPGGIKRKKNPYEKKPSISLFLTLPKVILTKSDENTEADFLRRREQRKGCL
jgi:hypothetical protein